MVTSSSFSQYSPQCLKKLSSQSSLNLMPPCSEAYQGLTSAIASGGTSMSAALVGMEVITAAIPTAAALANANLRILASQHTLTNLLFSWSLLLVTVQSFPQSCGLLET